MPEVFSWCLHSQMRYLWMERRPLRPPLGGRGSKKGLFFLQVPEETPACSFVSYHDLPVGLLEVLTLFKDIQTIRVCKTATR